jgi:hypothetical protein
MIESTRFLRGIVVNNEVSFAISFHSIVIRGLNVGPPGRFTKANTSTVEMVLSTEE